MKRNGLFIVTAALALLFLMLACQSSGTPATVGPAILDVVAATDLDESSKPVEVTSSYLPEDTIHLSVHVQNLVAGSAVKVLYKYNGETYEEGTLIAERAGSGYYGFSLTPHEYGHIPGTHTAEVYLDDVLAKTISFTIEGEAKTEVLQIVMARSLANDGRPIEPTTVFLPAQIVHTSVEVKNMVAGSEIRVLYTYEDGHKSEENVTVKRTGSGYLGFTLRPPDAGFPPGEYTVEVFVDGKPSGDAVKFTVSK